MKFNSNYSVAATGQIVNVTVCEPACVFSAKVNIFLFLLMLMLPMVVDAASLNAIDIKEDHVNFYVTKPIKWRSFSLSHPNRIIIDFENTHLSSSLGPSSRGREALGRGDPGNFSKNIINIRKGYPKPGVLRVVLDINENVTYRIREKPFSKQIILDLISSKKAANKSYDAKKTMIVVIDPGHGGRDPGAMGQYGTREKDVVMSIAVMLANIINKQPNMRAVLTREGDYYVSLRKRLQIARRVKADLFIAIHADSYFHTRAAGASVYSLSEHGATSVAARWLAQRENHSELGGVDLDGLPDQSIILRSVLLDLAQTATNQASLRCGANLLDSLSSVTRLHYARVEQAPFMVLKSPDIPSILVETGFISNVNEEHRLRDKRHQYKMAAALFEGINNFNKKYVAKEV